MKFLQKIKTFFNTFKEQREIKKQQKRNKKHARKQIKIERKQLKKSKITRAEGGSFKIKKEKDRGYVEGGWLQKRLKKPTKLLETWQARNKNFKPDGYLENKKINKKTLQKQLHEWNMKYNSDYKRWYEWDKRQRQIQKNFKEQWERWEQKNRKKWEKKLKKDIDFLDGIVDGDNAPKVKEKKAPKSRSERREQKRQYNRKYNSEYYDKNKDKHKLHYAHKKYKDNKQEEIEYLKRTIENQDQEIKRLSKEIVEKQEKIDDGSIREKEYKQQILGFEKQIDDLKKLIENLRDHIKEEEQEEEKKEEAPIERPRDNRSYDEEELSEEQIDELLEDLYKEFKEDEVMSRILGDDDNFERLFDIAGESVEQIVSDIIQDSPLYETYSKEEIQNMLIDKYS